MNTIPAGRKYKFLTVCRFYKIAFMPVKKLLMLKGQEVNTLINRILIFVRILFEQVDRTSRNIYYN